MNRQKGDNQMDIQNMPREQLGVCAEGNLHSVYLMFNANDNVESQLRPCIANVAQYIYELTDQYSDKIGRAHV